MVLHALITPKKVDFSFLSTYSFMTAVGIEPTRFTPVDLQSTAFTIRPRRH